MSDIFVKLGVPADKAVRVALLSSMCASSKAVESAVLDSMNAFPTQRIVHTMRAVGEQDVTVTFQFHERDPERNKFDPRKVRFAMDLHSDRATKLVKKIRKFNCKSGKRAQPAMIRVRPSCLGSIEMIADEDIPTFHFGTGANQVLRITFPEQP